jgi:hypothetical protein
MAGADAIGTIIWAGRGIMGAEAGAMGAEGGAMGAEGAGPEKTMVRGAAQATHVSSLALFSRVHCGQDQFSGPTATSTLGTGVYWCWLRLHPRLQARRQRTQQMQSITMMNTIRNNVNASGPRRLWMRTVVAGS